MEVTSPLGPPLDPEPRAADGVAVTVRGDGRGRSSSLRGRHPHTPPHLQITADLLSNGIDVYPQKEFDEDAEDRLVNEKFRVSGPATALSRGPSVPVGGPRATAGVALSHGNVPSGPSVHGGRPCP